jgi:hypothetical protein
MLYGQEIEGCQVREERRSGQPCQQQEERKTGKQRGCVPEVKEQDKCWSQSEYHKWW